MAITKVCTQCKLEKSVNEFYKDITQKSGYCPCCKKCRNKRNNVYSNARRRYDPEFKLLTNLRSRLGKLLKGKSKSKTRQLIGIDFETFTKWIDFQLEEGMTKENYGTIWLIDHVLPLA